MTLAEHLLSSDELLQIAVAQLFVLLTSRRLRRDGGDERPEAERHQVTPCLAAAKVAQAPTIIDKSPQQTISD